MTSRGVGADGSGPLRVCLAIVLTSTAGGPSGNEGDAWATCSGAFGHRDRSAWRSSPRVLGGLYCLTRYLPGAWRERGQVLVFVGPAVFLVFAGLFVPAVRTIWVSFRDDTRQEAGSGSTTTTRSSPARAPG